MSSAWREISERLRQSSPYRELRRRLGAAQRLPLPAAAWVGELLAQDLDRPLLVVVPHEADALAWMEASQLLGGSPVYFPAPSLSPYQETDASLQVRTAESVALQRVLSGEARTLVCSPRALFRKLPEPETLLAGVLEIRAGQEQPIEDLVLRLSRFGYRRADLVVEIGDFAVRGGVFDVYSPGESGPVRLDFFGETVESVWRFNPQDQRSQQQLDETALLPLSLYPSGAAEAERLADLLAARLGSAIGIRVAESLEALRLQGRFPGWEHYLPLLNETEVCLPQLLEGALALAISPAVLAAEVEQHARQLATDCAARQRNGGLAALGSCFFKICLSFFIDFFFINFDIVINYNNAHIAK